MKKTNASDIEEKKNEQLSIKSIELLKDTIGYNEFAEFYKLLFEKKNNGIEKKIAAIVSVCTLFFFTSSLFWCGVPLLGGVGPFRKIFL